MERERKGRTKKKSAYFFFCASSAGVSNLGAEEADDVSMTGDDVFDTEGTADTDMLSALLLSVFGQSSE